MENISISLSEGKANGISEVRVDGVVDTTTAGELDQVVESLVRRGQCRLVIDLAGVDYISSAGWGIFIGHLKAVRDGNGDIKLANLVPTVKEVFELLEFDRVLKSFESVAEARAEFGDTSAVAAKKKADQ